MSESAPRGNNFLKAEVSPQALSHPLEGEDGPAWLGFSQRAWLKIGIVAILLFAIFRHNLLRLWLKTNPFTGEPNWRHSIFVPLIGLYYLFINREELLKTPLKTAWSGLAILIAGLLLFTYAIYPLQNDFIWDCGMVVILFGVVTLLCGWKVMKIAWFPIVFLVCAFPWPELVYSWIAGPLQHLAASVAVFVLRCTGVDSLNTGTKIIMDSHGEFRTLNVAEACSGLRSLMTFITVGAMVAFLGFRPLWQKITITLSAIPIAIFCNVFRVSMQGLLDHYASQQWSESFAHQFVGLVLLIPGFFLLILVGWVLDRLFLEQADQQVIARKTPLGSQSAPAIASNKSGAVPRVKPAAKAAGILQKLPAPARAASRAVVPGAAAQAAPAPSTNAGESAPASAPPAGNGAAWQLSSRLAATARGTVKGAPVGAPPAASAGRTGVPSFTPVNNRLSPSRTVPPKNTQDVRRQSTSGPPDSPESPIIPPVQGGPAELSNGDASNPTSQ